MKKIVFRNSRGLRLFGDFYKSNSDSVIILVHGFMGDRHEWGRFDRAAEIFNKCGYNVLTFDFSGSGDSDDDRITVAKEVSDLDTAINVMKNRGMKKIGVVGLSLGGLITLQAYKGNIDAMVLWAPVTAPKSPEKIFTKKEIDELKESGFSVRHKPEASRKIIAIDKQFIYERQTVKQKELLSKINCPVLIIHGDKDDVIPIQDSENAVKHLKVVKFEVINGADHDFQGFLYKIVSFSLEWFRYYL